MGIELCVCLVTRPGRHFPGWGRQAAGRCSFLLRRLTFLCMLKPCALPCCVRVCVCVLCVYACGVVRCRTMSGLPVTISDSQLVIPQPEFDALASKARKSPSFALQLQGGWCVLGMLCVCDEHQAGGAATAGKPKAVCGCPQPFTSRVLPPTHALESVCPSPPAALHMPLTVLSRLPPPCCLFVSVQVKLAG